MKIGIVGLGVVGSAIKKGFEDLGHKVKVHDIKLKTNLVDVLDTKIVYLCLPTNPAEDGSCNIDVVGETVYELSKLKYKGIIAIKSTIIPGTFKFLETLFDKERLCHVPEFLREKYAYEDFTKKHNVLIVGTNNRKCYEAVVKCHGKYPKETLKLTPYEAEFVKYFSNVFKAVKITFANSFGKLCETHKVNYSKVLKAYELEGIKETGYLNYFGSNGGFAGMCLPKDVLALDKLATEHNINLFSFILEENKKYLND
jgi:UDPglucose 6-dehydrogenase